VQNIGNILLFFVTVNSEIFQPLQKHSHHLLTMLPFGGIIKENISPKGEIKRGIIMAEFCLDCWNKLNDTNLTEKEVVLSKDLDTCEGCAAWQNVVDGERGAGILRWLFPR